MHEHPWRQHFFSEKYHKIYIYHLKFVVTLPFGNDNRLLSLLRPHLIFGLIQMGGIKQLATHSLYIERYDVFQLPYKLFIVFSKQSTTRLSFKS